MSVSIKTLLASTACLALIGCGGGGSGGNSGPSVPTNTDFTNPTVSFSPAAITVEGRSSGESTLTATDNVGVTSTTVNCTNGGVFSNDTFTAPDVDVETESVCTATANDAAGNTGTATLTVTIPPGADITSPTLTVSTSATDVASGGTAELTITADDNRGAPIVEVTCDNGGTFADGIFTAPDVTTDTTVTCTITAEDDAGNIVTETAVFSVLAPDVSAPTVTFPAGSTLSVNSAETAAFVIEVADDSGEVIVPVVTCDNGGSWADDVFTALTTTTDVTVTCTVTATDSSGNETTDSFTVDVVGVAAPSSVNIFGSISFDFVPHDTATNGLDYDAIVRRPTRGITVQAVDGSGGVLATTTTNDTGRYSFDVDLDTDVRIRALAEIVSTSGALWDVKVVDNTSGDNVYAIQGNLVSSGSEARQGRNLNAGSGWGGSSYTGTRAAAPFAIIDPLYTTVTKFAEVDPDINFPLLLVGWSPQNTTGSFFTQGRIEILGDENNDTDEYDSHVIVHEWGHYFEDRLSRADSIGGPHSGGDRLDPRVAFGEGWGNAISGIILEDPIYRDSGGFQQASGFSFNVETNNFPNQGWFSETSVQTIIYDIFDSANDGADGISGGLGPIYETLIAPDYLNTPYFTTIFHFADQFRIVNPGLAAGFDALIADENIDGTGPDGVGETNEGNIDGALPVYKLLTSGGAAVEICSVNDAGVFNKLGNRNYLELTPPGTGNVTLTMTRTSGATNRDPDFDVYRDGTLQFRAISGANNTETVTMQLVGGVKYIIDAYDFNNVGQQGVSPGDSCFNFSAN